MERWVSNKRWDGSLVVKLVLAAGLVLIGDVVFWQWEQGTGVQGLFGLGLCIALFAARPAVRRDRRALMALALAAIYALAQMWDPSPLAFVLFWVAIGMATLFPATARFDDGWRWFQRLWIHGLKSLFGPLIDLAVAASTRRRRSVLRRGGLRRLAALGTLPAVGGVVFVSLFAAVNPVLETWLARLSLPAFDLTMVPRAILAALCFVLAWGVLRARPPRRVLGTFAGEGDLAVPGVSFASIVLSLILFNTLFAIQNAMDLLYLSRLAPLPQGITLADYAHRGAYPLVVTALLAALFVIMTSRPGSQAAASLRVRRLVTLWIAQNLVLVASAAWRTCDYVEAYSLTRFRIAALLWMAIVATGLVLVLWRMLRGRSLSWLINANLLSAGIVLSVVAFVDLGAVAARWNTAHAKEIDGDGAALDLCYLDELGQSSVLSLVALEQRPLPPALRSQVQALRGSLVNRLRYQQAHFAWSVLLDYRLAQADRVIATGQDTPLQERHCDHVYDD